MKDIAEIRRENVKFLIKKYGLSRAEFAEKTNIAYSQLANYIGENPVKNIGKAVAGRIEGAFGLPANWLDQDWQEKSAEVALPNNEPNFATSVIELIDTLKEMEKQGKLTAPMVQHLNHTLSTFQQLESINDN